MVTPSQPIQKAVVVTGSRHGRDYEMLRRFVGNWKSDGVGLIIHGAAMGVDSQIARLAIAAPHCAIPTLPMHAQWPKGHKAGPIRNGYMVEVARALRGCGWQVRCYAFPGVGKSTGTYDCMRRMKAAGFDVIEH